LRYNQLYTSADTSATHIIIEADVQKCKAVPVLYTKLRCGVEGELHSFLTTALDGIE